MNRRKKLEGPRLIPLKNCPVWPSPCDDSSRKRREEEEKGVSVKKNGRKRGPAGDNLVPAELNVWSPDQRTKTRKMKNFRGRVSD